MEILVGSVSGGAETMHFKLLCEADAAGPWNTLREAWQQPTAVLFHSCAVEATREVKRARGQSTLQRPRAQQLTFLLSTLITSVALVQPPQPAAKSQKAGKLVQALFYFLELM